MDILVNWLAHGTVVGIAAAAALRLIPASWTDARARVIWSGCGLVTLAPLLPLLAPRSIEPPVAPMAVAAVGSTVTLPLESQALAFVIASFWVLWCAAYALRFAAATSAARSAILDASEFPSTRQARLLHWSRVRGTGRITRLVISESVPSAAVLGLWRPVIAVSPRLLECLSDDDLDRVVLHEWAHVQRRDDVLQILQRAAHAIAGWHPALRWLERQIEIEREIACDRMAVRITGTAKGYATCLAAVASLQLPQPQPLLAVASGALTRRVRLILSGAADVQPPRAAGAVAALALAIVAMFAGSVRIVESRSAEQDLAAALAPIGAVESNVSAGFTSSATPTPATDEAPLRSELPLTAKARTQVAGTDGEATPARVDASRSAPALPGRTLAPATLAVPALAPPATAVADVASATNPNGDDPTTAAGTAAAMGAPGSDSAARTPWGAAADTAVAAGRRSRDAGVTIGGFFKRFGTNIATSF